MAVPGIDIVGPLPLENETVTAFSAGLSTAAKNVDGGQGPDQVPHHADAAAVMKSKGMEAG